MPVRAQATRHAAASSGGRAGGARRVSELGRGLPVADVRQLSSDLFARLQVLEEGTAEHSYVRGTLVELNMALVRHAARRFRDHADEMEDVLQVGTIGLLKAIDGFDPAYGFEFVTYAMPTILGEMRRYFRDTSWAVHVPRRLQELRVGIARATDRITAEEGREPTVAELAGSCEAGEEEIRRARTAAAGHTARSLDAPLEGGEQGAERWADRFGDVDKRFGIAEDVVALKPLIAALPERERRILGMRFCEDLTQTQIGERIGVSQMQVSRLLRLTLDRLRRQLLSDA
jgi:RNA polymerase sigma-B factor